MAKLKSVPAIVRVQLPNFDLHRVEESMRVSHLLHNGPAMTQEQIDHAILEYRKFLAQHKANGCPEQFEVPSLEADFAWHHAMCETKDYADQCAEYFGEGYFLHHESRICNGGTDIGDAPAQYIDVTVAA